jgi:hypothetical protein
VVLREQFKQACMAERRECHLCGGELGPIDYSGPHGSPMSFELDHLIPVSSQDGERYALEPSLFRASHALCNRRRSSGEVPVSEPGSENDGLGVHSEQW